MAGDTGCVAGRVVRIAPILGVSSAPDGDRLALAVTGEIDLGNAQDLATALARAADGSFRWVDLDLREVTFVDGAGRRCLAAFCATLTRAGRTVTVTRPVDRAAFISIAHAGLPDVDAPPARAEPDHDAGAGPAAVTSDG